jgi:hypothetical protein
VGEDPVWDFSAPDGPRLVSGRPARAATPAVLEPTVPVASSFDSGIADAGLGGTGGAGTVKPIGAPVHWLAGAGVCVVAAFGFGVPSGRHPLLWLTGWGMGGFACVSLLAVFTLADSHRRTDAWYTARPIVSYARTALIVCAALAVSLNAWRFADWMSRR